MGPKFRVGLLAGTLHEVGVRLGSGPRLAPSLLRGSLLGSQGLLRWGEPEELTPGS